MSNKILSYIIFSVALVVSGVFIYIYIKYNSDVELGKVKKISTKEEIKMDIEKQEKVVITKSSKDRDGEDKNDSSNVTIRKRELKGDENISKELNGTDQIDVSKVGKKDIKLKKDLIDGEKIIGVDPVPVKLHFADNNYTESNKTTKPKSLNELLDDINVELGNPVLIRIFKSSYLLEIWIKGDKTYHHLKSYPICAFSGNLGPKLKEGDLQAPEGFYEVRRDSLNPNSKFHLSMNVGYPNRYDREYNRTGSYIMIHGGCASVGCFAMGDKQIEEIYEIVESALNGGQKSIQVEIFPFRMTDREMKKHSQNLWYPFWENLKSGYEYFEKRHTPPVVEVVDGNYTFK